MGKLVHLERSGEDVEVDASIVEHIHDPLMHLVRNAVDHGVETPAVRRARGKPPGGVVSLRASREASSIVVKVEDDGAGLDRDRIRTRALSSGLLQEDEERDDASLFQFVFEPGFTTAERITEVSGRGLGMDVVKRNVEALRGSVTLDTTPSVGTVVSLRLPLSLSILDVFLVGVGRETYVLPLESVLECVDLPEEERGSSATGVLYLRGQPLPYLRLRDCFTAEGEQPARESVVVVKHAAGKAGIAVDALLGQGQTVIKPLGKLFQRIPGVSGSTILGNGRVALIVDVSTLLAPVLSNRKRYEP
jgi:two-component system chemotaxis sensor kinase CheA